MLPALVLTAGIGTRLDPLTRLVAKPAVPVAGRSLVERVLAWLGREGVSDVVLNLHYRPETITGLVGDGAHLGLRVRYSWERDLLGSAGGPRRALPLLDAPTFLLVNGDTLCDLNLTAMIAAHRRTAADITLAVVPNPAPDHYNGLELDGTGRVRAFVPKGRAQASWHFVGVQVVAAEVFTPLADGVPAETIGGLYRDRLTAGGGIHGWPADRPFLDIGTPRDYLQAVLSLAGLESTGGAVERKDVHIDPRARVTRSVLWPGAHIGPGVELDECIVAGSVRVPASLSAHRAVLTPASIVRPGDRVERIGDIAVFPL